MRVRHLVPQLGRVLANPAVVKVLHGCERDVLWLQRDLGLYLVNCFDSHVAAKALNYPALSLAHLLKMHCGVSADKKHQLSDWRLRELSPEMLHYANEDTRYLLYVYDRLRQELWKKLGRAGLEHVFDASRQLCLARYEKEAFDPSGYRKLFREGGSSLANSAAGAGAGVAAAGAHGKQQPHHHQQVPRRLEDLSALQEAALAALWDYRDRTARLQDESCVAVMSNAELLRIGAHLPRTEQQLEQHCGPLSALTRSSCAEILAVVADVTSVGPSTKAKSADSQSVPSDSAGKAATATSKKTTLTSPACKKSSKTTATAAATASESSSSSSSSSNAGQDQKVDGDSLYTFTPAVLSPDATQGRRSGLAFDVLSSPVPAADEVT